MLGPVAGGWPQLSVPTMHWVEIRQLMPLALTMALVGFAQTISIGKSLGNKFGYDIDANRELTALGLVQSHVECVARLRGVRQSRALGVECGGGARTQVAAIVSALCVGVTDVVLHAAVSLSAAGDARGDPDRLARCG